MVIRACDTVQRRNRASNNSEEQREKDAHTNAKRMTKPKTSPSRTHDSQVEWTLSV